MSLVLSLEAISKIFLHYRMFRNVFLERVVFDDDLLHIGIECLVYWLDACRVRYRLEKIESILREM